MRHTEACDRCDRQAISMPTVERPRHRGLDRRHVADDGHVLVPRPLDRARRRPPEPAGRAPQRLAALGHPRRVRPASGPTPPTARRRAALPRRCRTTARSTARRPRTACRRPAPSAGPAAAGWRSARRRDRRSWRRRSPAPPPPRRAARRCDPAASRRHSAPCGRGAPGSARSRVFHRASAAARRAVRVRPEAVPARRLGQAGRPPHPDERSPARSAPARTAHQPASDLGQRGAVEARPTERPPEQVGVGPRAVEHEVQAACRSAARAAARRAGRRPIVHEHHDGQQEQAEHKRVEHPGAAEQHRRRAAGPHPTMSSR